MSLKLKNISKSYGAKSVLKGLSLEGSKGDIVGLLGRNGAGKSTTFKMITGLIQIDDGQLEWNDERINSQSSQWKKKIGYLSEQNPLYPEMYVKQFLHHISRLHGISNPSDRINKIIDQLDLTEYASKKIKTLSKGFKQRVGIAQSILNDPELLILDEPTSGLDPTQLIEIRKYIKSLAKDRIVILSSHILSEVEEICTRVLFLKDGKVSDVVVDKNASSSLLIRVEFDKAFKAEWFANVGRVKSISDKVSEIQIDDLLKRKEIFDTAVIHDLRILEMLKVERDLEREFINQTL